MCGLTGYVNITNRDISTDVIKRMLELQKHRGPDDNGIVYIDKGLESMTEVSVEATEKMIDSSVVMGFNRLSILDLSHNGHQPMVDSENNVVLMLNGEVYNAFDYRDSLIEKGYSFKSKTDTEVVLNLYLEYGVEEMALMLNGMFAIVIFDKRIKKLFLLRDRFGIKPLYHTKTSDFFCFSSEIKSFKAIPGMRFELDRDKLDEYLIFRNNINSTLIKGVENIDQGAIYCYDLLTHDLSKSKYFDINLADKHIMGDVTVRSIEESLKRAVEYQMLSDVKVGAQLSGGIDSSLVTHFLNEKSENSAVETISITFDNPRYSEEHYMDYVIEKENVKAHKFILDGDYYINNLYNATWHFEHPINHPNTIGLYLLSKEAKKYVTVLLSGEGADELFGGYDSYTKLYKNPFFTIGFLSKLKSNYRSILTFLRYYLSKKGRMLTSYSFGQVFLAKSLYKPFRFSNAIVQREGIYSRLNGTWFTKQRKFDFLTYLPDLLMRQDKMSMAHSIENRVPFLDNELVALSFSSPESLFLGRVDGKLEGKYVLKQLSERIFGKSFTYRKKAGFGIPLKEFFESDAFAHLWKEKILPGIETRELFNKDIIKKWYNSIHSLPNREIEMLWIAISFEIWAQQYLD